MTRLALAHADALDRAHEIHLGSQEITKTLAGFLSYVRGSTRIKKAGYGKAIL